ncbi:MAG: hypothetical protein ACI4GZ_05005 [Ruminococcus sp.]
MKNKILILLLTVLMAVTLSGCDSITLNVSELMHPPKATGENAAIQELIDSYAGKGYTLKYPQNGTHRSAITSFDIDADNTDEAVAFYLPAGEAQTVHIIIMDTVDGDWVVIGDHPSKSSTVDRLMFTDLDGDGISEITVGWSTYNALVNDLSVYLVNGSESQEVTSASTYSNILQGDFREQGKEELLLISLYTADRPASASLVTLNDTKNSIYSIAETDFDGDVISLAKVQTGEVFYSQFGAVIDGVNASGTYNTQIFYYSGYYDSLVRVSFTGDAPDNQAVRNYAVLSEDIDGDGIIEIPNAFKMNIDQTQTDAVPAALVYWCEYTADGSLEINTKAATSLVYGFYFFVPDSWEGKFTAYVNYSTNEVIFYEWDDRLGPQDVLLVIKMFTDKSWNDGVSAKGYTELTKNDSYVYSFMTPPVNNDLLLTNEQVQASFRLIDK